MHPDVHITSHSKSLPVMEHFYTLQGEGVHQGKAAYFIRLGGCDVGCVWCDVKDSWDAGKHPLRKIEDLVAEVKNTPAEIVVITGGEPLMHDLTELTGQLHKAGLRTHMETSGSSPLSGSWYENDKLLRYSFRDSCCRLIKYSWAGQRYYSGQ